MSNGIGINPNLKIPITEPRTQKPEVEVKGGSTGFEKLLNEKVQSGEGVKFSAHALKRMKERNIDLNALDVQKINEAMAKVGERGSKESLILSDKGAFIVNIKNQKVITAIDPKEARESTFTNIDSTILI